MAFTVIVVLFIGLLVISVVASAMQQHKERLATLKRAEFTKLRGMLEDTEEILLECRQCAADTGHSTDVTDPYCLHPQSDG